MANLNGNTTYGSPTTQPNFANLSNLTKNLQQKSQDSSANTFQSAIVQHYNPNAAAKMFSPWKSISSTIKPGAAFPVDEPIIQGADVNARDPIPSYEKFVPPDSSNHWALPSDKATLRNWPGGDLGGGQYITDPTQPNTIIKSDRVLMNDDLNPGARQSVLGGLSGKLYQVDHIVPLWLGGADTIGNLQVLDLPTHEKKTSVQAVPLTLLANKKINLEEAKLMAMTWKTKDATGLPEADSRGYVPVDVAEKYAQKWKDDLEKPNTMKFFGESFKQNMQDFGKGWLPTPIREFAKGLVGGGTAGIVPDTGASKDSGTLGSVSNIAGNIAGTITGLGLLSKGLGATVRGTQELMGFKKAVDIADEAMQTAGLVADVGDLSAKSVATKARMETMKKVAQSAGLLSLWGQIGLSGREAVDPKVGFDLKNHMTQFFNDVAYGSLLGTAGQNVKGYATVGLGTAALSLMGQYYTGHDDIKAALQDAALMTALHTLGYQKGIIDPKMRIGNEEAFKMSSNTFNNWLGDVVPQIKKGQPVPEVLKLDIPKIDAMRAEYQAKYPQDQRFQGVGPVSNEAEAINFMEQAARRELGNTVARSNGEMPIEDIKKEMQRITVSKNQLYNQTLPPEERIKKEWSDLISMGDKLRPGIKSEQLRSATNVTQLLDNMPFNVSNEPLPNESKTKFLTGNVPTTGYGTNIDTVSKKTIDDFFHNPERFSNKVYIVKDPDVQRVLRFVETEQLMNKGKSTVGNPDEALRVFIQEKTPEGIVMRPAGYIPREVSFDAKDNPLNKTYYEITNRLRNIIQTAKDGDQLYADLSQDRSQIPVDEQMVKTLMTKKANLAKMSDEELYSILKPSDAFEKFNSGLNNSAIASEMDKNGVKVLVVDRDKVLPTGGAMPRVNPENPYLTVSLNEQDWLRSMAMRDLDKPLNPLEKAIKAFAEKSRTDSLSAAAGTPTPAPAPIESITGKNGETKFKQITDITRTPAPKKASLETKYKDIKSTVNPTEITAPKVDTVTSKKKAPEAPKSPVAAPEPVKANPITKAIESVKKLPVKETSIESNKGVISGLVEKGKLSPEEAKPFLVKEKRFNELNDAAANRNLEFKEIKEMTSLSKELNQFLQNKGLMKKPVALPPDFRQDPKLSDKNKTSLVSDALIKAESDFEGLKSSAAVKDPESYISALKKSASGARSMVVNNKLNLSSADRTDLIKSFDQNIENMIFKYADTMFEGTENVKGMKYDTKYHQYVGIDPDTGKEAHLKYQTSDEKPVVEKETEDQKLAKKYGLDVNEDGYLRLDKARRPMFSDSFKKSVPSAENKNPIDFWGNELIKDLKVNEKIKTIHSENFIKELDIMEKSPNTYSLWGKMINKGLKKIIVDPQEPWLKKLMEENAGKSFTFNSLMKPNSSYMRRMFQTFNRSGHPISQPAERIISQVEGASPEAIKEIDRKTVANEEAAAERRASRGNNEALSKNDIIDENVSPEDLKGMSVKDTTEMEKVQDLTNFELRFPSLIYEELTGKTPPKEAIANDAIAALKDFVSNYSPNIKKNGKIKKVYLAPSEWDSIKNEIMGAMKVDGKGGPYDGKGGFFGNMMGGLKNMLSSTIEYHRAPDTSYDARGVKVTDQDLDEIAPIVALEVSNRPDRLPFETNHIVNTAINRAASNPKLYGGSISKVMKAPAQYQSYAPNGSYDSRGNKIESRYQKLVKGTIGDSEKQKVQMVRQALNQMKTNGFQDTTQGKQFYVHAADGSMWLGKTIQEAKDLANKHEKSIKLTATNWRKAPGLPARGISGNF